MTVRLTVVTSRKLRKGLEAASQSSGLSLSEIVRRAIVEELKKL